MPGSCCTTCARAAPPTATRSASISARSTADPNNHLGVYIPPGVAHGFASLTDMTITYLVDGYYNPADELGVAWDDPAIGADWGLTDPILSARDQANPRPRPARAACGSRTSRCAPEGSTHATLRDRRRRVHRLQLRPPRARDHRRRGDRLRRADLRRQPREPGRPRGRTPATGSCTATSATATPSARRCPATTPWCTSPPRATSTGRCSTPTCSCAPTARAPTSCATSPPQVGVERFLHISTDEVYGSIDEGSFTETDPLAPRSPYSAAKAGSDLIAMAYHETYGLPVVLTRSSNQFGPYQFPEKLIPFFVTTLLDGKQGAALRRRPERARLAVRPRQLRGRRPGAAPGRVPARSTTSAPATSAPTARSPTVCSRSSARTSRASSTSRIAWVTIAATRSPPTRSPHSAGRRRAASTRRSTRRSACTSTTATGGSR